MKWYHFLIGGLVGGALFVLFLVLGRRQRAQQAVLDAMLEYHKRDIAEKRAEVERLLEDASNTTKADRLKAEIAEKLDRLEAGYQDSGLSADEIDERLRRLGY